MLNNSIWERDISQRENLNKNIETEIAIIGGGMAGILIGAILKGCGKKAVILEAGRIASGQTANTTAKITAQHGYIYHNMIKKFGADKARLYLKANLDAVNWYAKYIEENKIDCEFSRTSAFIYSLYGTEKLEKEKAAYNTLGVACEMTDNTELPLPVAGALRLDNQAQFDPLRFIAHISANLEIYENTRVEKVVDNILFCKTGKVTAQHIVFACHYPFVNFPGMFFTREHQERSYVVALENAQRISGMYIGIDKNSLSFRGAHDLLLLGGGGHRTGENSLGGKYDMLLRTAKSLYPKSAAFARWSAQDCITADGIPYIGRFGGNDNTYIATGFAKWGMSTSAVAARLICDLICRKDNAAAAVFSPSRFSFTAAKGIAREVYHSSKGIIRQNFCIPKSRLENIPIGNGAVVIYEGKRVGVYRESAEEYHIVDTKCPHLGCRLEWNPDEKSWDCPCHGSRFDYSGRLITGPAQRGLNK